MSYSFRSVLVCISVLVYSSLLIGAKTVAATASQNVRKSLRGPSTQAIAQYLDGSSGRDWPGYGRTFGESHYSPLTQVNTSSVGKLGLTWWLDLGPENSVSQPIAVDGILYFATGYSIIHAVDAASGKPLWTYDPHAAAAAGMNLRLAWGSRGVAWWKGRIYAGTLDGRLIAIDAKNGKPIWSVQTLDKTSARYITGAPRVFDDKVIIGHGGDDAKLRGYVTCYDAQTGKQLWRVFTIPGEPTKGFETKAMEMAAKTWSGAWWENGGGGAAWNAFAYDPESHTIFFGTGNGAPWNRRVRSENQGDNLFISSVIALDADSGAYKWHYQVNPGEEWDYDAATDVQLATVKIEGRLRKVLFVAPKNGFFYVIDRTDGQLISAAPFAKVTWATKIDLSTGRPIENADARFPDGETAEVWPSMAGAHNWLPQAYSPQTQLVYIPVMEMGMRLSDAKVDVAHYHSPSDRSVTRAVDVDMAIDDPLQGTGALVAWDPASQTARWTVRYPTTVNGGVMATGGNLVFQGNVESQFFAYEASSGFRKWSFPTQTPLMAPPITYLVNGKQYISVLTGLGALSVLAGPSIEKYGINPNSQMRRVLTFAIDGNASLPVPVPARINITADPELNSNLASAREGQDIYVRNCMLCHGVALISGTHAPDLRYSVIPRSAEAFNAVLRDGALVANGMPQFTDLSDEQREAVRQYLRIETQQAFRNRTAQ